MSTATYEDTHAPARAERAGFFKRLLAGMIEARQRQARQHVNEHLSSLNDDDLTALGVDRNQLERERARFYGFF